MSMLAANVESHLARTARWTDRLKQAAPQVRGVRNAVQGLDFLARGMLHAWRNRRYLSAAKLANMALVNLQFMLKTERVAGMPYKMKIESTNICNTKCQLCPTGIGLEGRPKGKMSFEQFTDLIARFRRTLYVLDLSMWGDPLIVPDIDRMIRHAHDNRIWTYISSNLHAYKLGKGQAEQLVDSGLDLLTCSLHGASQATYEIYQPGKNFEQAVAKVREIIATRDRMNSATPEVQLNFVVTRHNEHEIDDFKQLAADLGCKAVFSQAAMNLRFIDKDKSLTPLGLAPDLVKKKSSDHLKQWLPENREYVLEPYEQLLRGEFNDGEFNGSKMMDCSWPWKASVINWDGGVSTCCGSFGSDEDLGNVFEQPFSKIWNGRLYRLSRRSFKQKVDDKDVDDVGCAKCPGFML